MGYSYNEEGAFINDNNHDMEFHVDTQIHVEERERTITVEQFDLSDKIKDIRQHGKMYQLIREYIKDVVTNETNLQMFFSVDAMKELRPT